MQTKVLYAALAVLALSSLTACGSTGEEELATSMTPEYAGAVDPADAKLHSAVQTYLGLNKGPKNSQYEYVRVDLNNDGLREGLVMFNLPHSYWCGWSGCTMAVFEARDNSFALLSQTSRIRGPLVVAASETNGWGDLAVRVTGTDMYDHNVLLKFDGSAYPDNPIGQETVPYDLADLGSTRLFP